VVTGAADVNALAMGAAIVVTAGADVNALEVIAGAANVVTGAAKAAPEDIVTEVGWV